MSGTIKWPAEKIVKKPASELAAYEKNSRTHSEAQIKQIEASIQEWGWTMPILIDEKGTVLAGHARLLAAEFGDLEALGYNVELTGFTLDEIGKLDVSGEDGKTDPDAVPDVPEEANTKPGQLWKLGEHRLLCGDSTDRAAVDKLMGGSQADLLLTDPPYNVAYEGKTKEALKIENDEMSAAVDAVGWPLRQMLIWLKNSMVMGRKDYHFKHEPCLYGWKGGAAHYWASDRKQTTILEFDRPTKSTDHPTMKPVALIEYQLRNNTKPKDIVLDLFAGSGSMVIAAEKAGRKGYAMELDPKYCDVIIRRWEEFTGKKAELMDG